MSYTKRVKNCRKHSPDIHGYCGPASMMTCLEGLGMNVSEVRQTDFYELARGESGEAKKYWHSAPDLLVEAMNKRWPGMSAQVEYVLAVTEYPRELDLAMAAGIELLNAPSIALVQGGGHWISVVGYCAENEVTSPKDTEGRVIAMESINCGKPLKNEEAPDHVPEPIIHLAKDRCGKSGQEPMLSYTPLMDWESQDGWMSRVTVGEKWTGHRVAIVPKATGAHLQARVPKTVRGDRPMGRLAGGESRSISLPGEVIPPEVARDCVRRTVEYSKLHLRPPWANHLGKGDAKAIPQPGEPVLVHHVDDPQKSYYIVPLLGSRVAATVNAINGRVLEFGLFPTIPNYKPWCPEAAAKAIQRATASGKFPIKNLHPGEIHPGLVWKRRRQAYTKFAPLLAFRHEDALWGLNRSGLVRELI